MTTETRRESSGGEGNGAVPHGGQDTPAGSTLSGGIVDYSMLMVIKALEEVTSMSARERNRILESIHGVGDDENYETSDEIARGDYLSSEASRRRQEASVAVVAQRLNSRPSGQHHNDEMPSSQAQRHHDTMTSNTPSIDQDVAAYFYRKARSKTEPDAVDESASHQNERMEHDQPFEYDHYHCTSGRGVTPSHQLTQEPPPSNLLLSSSPTDGGRFFMEKLKELNEAIGQIQYKVAYNQAQQKCDGYVDDPKFRLIFLRANSFDAIKAAKRLVSFMEEKLHRFGPEALTRQLTMDDLSRTSRSLLVKRGVMQILPTRDSSGRAVLVTYFHFFRLQDELRRHPASLGDLIFYVLSVMAEDQETQRRGIVTVGVIVSPSRSQLELAIEFLRSPLKDVGASIDRWCPLKCHAHHHWIYENAAGMMREIDEDPSTRTSGDSATSIHHAIPEPSTKKNDLEHGDSDKKPARMAALISSGHIILDTIMGCMGREYRIRTRVHEGLFGEYKEILKTFGIAGNRLPFTMDGSEIRVSGAHIKWIQKRREKEGALILHRVPRSRKSTGSTSASSGKTSTGGGIHSPAVKPTKRGAASKPNAIMLSCFDVIDIPGRHDVCLGKGMGLHQHSGNIAMRAMMEPLLKEYDAATSSRRQELNRIILQAINLTGGRFLTNREAPTGAWFTIEHDHNVLEKTIGGIFRSMVSRTKNHAHN